MAITLRTSIYAFEMGFRYPDARYSDDFIWEHDYFFNISFWFIYPEYRTVCFYRKTDSFKRRVKFNDTILNTIERYPSIEFQTFFSCQTPMGSFYEGCPKIAQTEHMILNLSTAILLDFYCLFNDPLENETKKKNKKIKKHL